MIHINGSICFFQTKTHDVTEKKQHQLRKTSEWQHALGCFQILQEAQVEPNLICFNAMISASEILGE